MKREIDLTGRLLSNASAIEALSTEATLDALYAHMTIYVRRSFPNLAAYAEDIVMEAIESVYRALDKKQNREAVGNLNALIRTAVMHRAIDVQRQRTSVLVSENEELLLNHIAIRDSSFEEKLLINNVLDKAMESLDNQERDIIQAFREGMTLREIAEQQGLSLRRVDYMKQRALKKLRIELSDFLDA